MPNPYHNHLGEFCSKDDMKASIVMLTKSGQQEKALQLTSEFKAIQEAENKRDFFKNSDVNNIVIIESTKSLLASFPRASENPHNDVQYCGRILENVDDKDLPKVVEALEAEKAVWEEAALQPALEKEQEEKQNFKEKTGYESVFALNQAIRSEMISAESSSHEIFAQIRQAAQEEGIPEGQARYYTNSSKTKMGYADDYRLSSGALIKRPENKIQELNLANFPKSIKDKEMKEKFSKALEKVLDDPANVEKIEKINKHATTFNSLTATAENMPSTKNVLDKAREIAFASATVQKYSALIEGVKGLQDWRKTLRASGVKTTRITPVRAGVLDGSRISVDGKGKVKNLWAVNSTNGSPTVDKIIAVKKNDFSYFGESYLLVGESGKTYNETTHYHSYKRENTAAQIIVDDTVPLTKTLDNNIRFNMTIDSGD